MHLEPGRSERVGLLKRAQITDGHRRADATKNGQDNIEGPLRDQRQRDHGDAAQRHERREGPVDREVGGGFLEADRAIAGHDEA